MRESLIRIPAVALFLGLTASLAVSQVSWYYKGEVKFPVADSAIVRPHLCTVDSSGNLWVISSTALDTAAHNALYKAGPTDTVLTQVVDFTALNDPLVGSLRGITAVGNDIFVVIRQPGPASNFAANIYVFRGGDAARKEAYGSGLGNPGYGTFVYGLSATRDTFLLAGISYQTTCRFYNFNRTVLSPAYGSYVPPANYALEPGGPNTEGVDVIRDVATIPAANYNDSTTVFYSARNSSSKNTTSGGIALWIGGTQTDPARYRVKRVSDFFAELALGTGIPYGITADKDANVYVAGVDTLRRWVKAYTVDTSGMATLYAELPSLTDPSNPNPAGAPFNAPCDVALTSDGTKAYVIDEFARTVFVFSTSATGVTGERSLTPSSVGLSQNYPNPFNPSTTIRLDLPTRDHVSLVVYDLLGRPVASVIQREMPAGVHWISFDASEYSLSSGIYIYRLVTGSAVIAKQMVLMK